MSSPPGSPKSGRSSPTSPPGSPPQRKAPPGRRAWGLSLPGPKPPPGSVVKVNTGEVIENLGCYRPNPSDEDLVKKDFIYGGPFLPKRRVDGFVNTVTPMNVQFAGIYKQSQAYDNLKDTLPIILTKIIDDSSKLGNMTPFVEHVAKVKNALVTNKMFEDFAEESSEHEEWNLWIKELDVANERHFLNAWSWTESYVYRKVYEGLELNPGLLPYDYFAEQKMAAFANHVEPMCVVAEKLLEVFCVRKEDKKEKKDEFSQLAKVSLWANHYEFPVTQGEAPDPEANLPAPIMPLSKPGKPPKKPKKGAPPGPPPLTNVGYFDPFQVNLDLKPNTLLDDSGKGYDLLEKRATKMKTQREKFDTKTQGAKFKQKCSCHRIARLVKDPIWKVSEETGEIYNDPDIQLKGEPGVKKKKEKKPKPPPPDPNAPPPARIVCPSKRTAPDVIYLDIVTNNAGFELFTDLCLAQYILCQEVVEKVRIHVKKYPWQVLDATERDLRNLISWCKTASFRKTSEPPPPTKPNEEPREPKDIGAAHLNKLGTMWENYLDDGTFIICDEDYWTYPWTYPDMKKYDIFLYRKLQFAALIIWKGDFNYRKLLKDRNCVPMDKFEPSLLGFQPAPNLAIRVIKSELCVGLPKGRKEQLNELFTDKWPRKAMFGTIQLSKKAENMPKKPDRPCLHYGDTCFDLTCPLEPAVVMPPPPPPPEEEQVETAAPAT